SPRLRDYYGSTEGGGATVLQPEDMRHEADSVGRPSFGVELEVVDPAGRRCPPGTEGSVRWRGPGVPVDDEAAPGVRGGWFYPGDRGRIDANSFLRLAGRDVALIIRGGVNINPAEVEAALRLCPGVSDAAVIGVPSPELGEEVGACIVANAAVTAEAIIADCRARLAHYKIPRRIRLVAELPRNAGGKVVLARLREMLAQ
ncbi:MAG: long-chain fatty acid--CoA ligase, partial [Alphaproteobacteria bacterium]|nr:long-chain fatty acid--CoA ligase [Alphaproteobacteria bacterium]